MSYRDIFKKSFLEGWAGDEINAMSASSVILVTAIMALFIFVVYKLVSKKQFYSWSFNVSLVGVALITSAIILTIQSNIVVSLGMVGALSIVRFRTAIKDPLDLMFMFWSISVGIICGAGLAEIAVVLSLAIAIAIFVFDKIPSSVQPLILIINLSNADCEEELLGIINQNCKYSRVKSRNRLSSGAMDMTIEVKAEEQKKLLDELLIIDGIESASLLEHDGEVVF